MAGLTQGQRSRLAGGGKYSLPQVSGHVHKVGITAIRAYRLDGSKRE